MAGYLLRSQVADFAEVRMDPFHPAFPHPDQVAYQVPQILRNLFKALWDSIVVVPLREYILQVILDVDWKWVVNILQNAFYKLFLLFSCLFRKKFNAQDAVYHVLYIFYLDLYIEESWLRVKNLQVFFEWLSLILKYQIDQVKVALITWMELFTN